MSEQDTEFTLVLLFINYCIIFHVNNCKPTFASPSISYYYIIYLTNLCLIQFSQKSSEVCIIIPIFYSCKN